MGQMHKVLTSCIAVALAMTLLSACGGGSDGDDDDIQEVIEAWYEAVSDADEVGICDLEFPESAANCLDDHVDESTAIAGFELSEVRSYDSDQFPGVATALVCEQGPAGEVARGFVMIRVTDAWFIRNHDLMGDPDCNQSLPEPAKPEVPPEAVDATVRDHFAALEAGDVARACELTTSGNKSQCEEQVSEFDGEVDFKDIEVQDNGISGGEGEVAISVRFVADDVEVVCFGWYLGLVEDDGGWLIDYEDYDHEECRRAHEGDGDGENGVLQEVVRAYYEAYSRQDIDGICTLESARYKGPHCDEDYTAQFNSGGTLTFDDVAVNYVLPGAGGARADVSLTITTDEGTRQCEGVAVHLVVDDSDWRIDDVVLDNAVDCHQA